MKILLTGAAGFIGSHTAERLLARGDEVVGLDDFNDYYPPAVKRSNIARSQTMRGFTLMEGDIRDAALVENLFRNNRFDAVVHLAARAGVRPSLQNPALYEAANVQGLLNLLEASIHHGKPYFVFASSSSVYGISPRLPWREDDAADCPISPYAITKRAGELLCFSYHQTYGLDTCSLRFFTVYGPRQRPEMAIAKFFRAILDGRPITIYGDGSARRDFTYVEDIVDGLLAALDRRFGHEIINLGGAHTVTVMEMVQAIGETTGRKPDIRFEAAQAGDVPATWADSSKARRLLGAAPQDPAHGRASPLSRMASWRAQRSRPCEMRPLREFVPWWGKLGLKLVLSRLPLPYAFWQNLGIFRHGRMDRTEYAFRVFQEHFQRVAPMPGFTCLELGPGDSLCTALLATAHGAARTWLVDTAPFAKEDSTLYADMASLLEAKGFTTSRPPVGLSVFLESCHAAYLTKGLTSLREIPSASLDFIFSQAVLEHVRLADFDDTLRELHRILRPGGRMSHSVDLQDHLEYALNNLRFSHATWESEWMARSGFYTNRIRFTDMVHRLESAGFLIHSIERQSWERLPTPRSVLANPFSELPEEELRIFGFSFVAERAAGP